MDRVSPGARRAVSVTEWQLGHGAWGAGQSPLLLGVSVGHMSLQSLLLGGLSETEWLLHDPPDMTNVWQSLGSCLSEFTVSLSPYTPDRQSDGM